MNAFLKLSNEDRKGIIFETAALKKISPIIIEKDFWVCWILEKIVNIPQISENITFKGGTSLSKVFHLIERFSEDIDLAFKRSYLGFGGENEPEEATSKKQREKQIEELTSNCIREIKDRFFPLLYTVIRNEIDPKTNNWLLEISKDDPQTVEFYYPSILDTAIGNYIQPIVKIEMGAHSDDWPVVDGVLNSYIEEVFKDVFDTKPISIKTLSAERTFWEKATILHAEFYRPNEKITAIRSSRHYYDLYQMHKKGISLTALQQIDLLDRVAKHKSIFFRSGWAKYEEAKLGTLRIIPKPERISELMQDYIKMREMFFAIPPAFDDIINVLKELENSINSQSLILI